MNQTAAIAKALLNKETLNIKTAFVEFGCSNLPREIGRSIERKFLVDINKIRKEGKSRYGLYSTWYNYKLVASKNRKEAIKKMRDYVKEHSSKG